MTPPERLRATVLSICLAVSAACRESRDPDVPFEPRIAGEPSAELIPEGQRIFRRKRCANCHKTSGMIPLNGPVLTGVGSRYTTQELEQWIREPWRYRASTVMPPWDGTDGELEALIAYLRSLR